MKAVSLILLLAFLCSTFATEGSGYDSVAYENYMRQRNGGIAMVVGGALMIGGGIVMMKGDADSAPVYGGILTGIGVGINVGGIILLVKAKRQKEELQKAEPRPIDAGSRPLAPTVPTVPTAPTM